MLPPVPTIKRSDDPVPGALGMPHHDLAQLEAWEELAQELRHTVDAANDLQAVENWIRVCSGGSPHTDRAYLREARRLLAWLFWKLDKKPPLLPRLTVPLAVDFLAWLQRPAGVQIPGDALAAAGFKSAAQPVREGLSSRSIVQTVGVLSSLYLNLTGQRAPWGMYAPINPFAPLRAAASRSAVFHTSGEIKLGERDYRDSPKRRRKMTVLDPLDEAGQVAPLGPDAVPRSDGAREPDVVTPFLAGYSPITPRGRAISKDNWAHVLHTIELMRSDESVRPGVSLQAWWVIRLLHHTVLRRAEAVGAKMGAIRIEDGICKLQVIGKGKKVADVILSDLCMRDLQVYRAALGMTPMPSPSETGPLIASSYEVDRRRGKHISVDTLYRRVRDVFERTALRLKGSGHPEASLVQLAWGSTHWVRHTGITHMLDAGVSMRTTSAHARHSSTHTTARYDNQDDKDKSAEINEGAAKTGIDWSGAAPVEPSTAGSEADDVDDTAGA